MKSTGPCLLKISGPVVSSLYNRFCLETIIFQEVCSLPFVGDRLAKKIWEIIETGHLRRLDHIDPKVELLNKFSGVWGAGPKTAEQWVAQVSVLYFHR